MFQREGKGGEGGLRGVLLRPGHMGCGGTGEWWIKE